MPSSSAYSSSVSSSASERSAEAIIIERLDALPLFFMLIFPLRFFSLLRFLRADANLLYIGANTVSTVKYAPFMSGISSQRTKTQHISSQEGQNKLTLVDRKGTSAKSARGPIATQYLAHFSISSSCSFFDFASPPSLSLASSYPTFSTSSAPRTLPSSNAINVLKIGYKKPTLAKQYLVLNTETLNTVGTARVTNTFAQ